MKNNTIKVFGNLYDEPQTTISTDTDIFQKDQTDPFLSQIFTEYEFGLNLDPAVLYINTDIEDPLLYDMIAKINLIIKYRKKNNINELDPITLIINSSGGSVYTAFAMIDYMRSLNIKINTVCRGRAMSAAALILTCGTGTRAASKNSTIMFHEISSDFFGKTSDVKQTVKHLEVLEESFLTLLEETTKKEKDWWKTTCIKDVYFLPTDALSHGIIDAIV